MSRTQSALHRLTSRTCRHWDIGSKTSNIGTTDNDATSTSCIKLINYTDIEQVVRPLFTGRPRVAGAEEVAEQRKAERLCHVDNRFEAAVKGKDRPCGCSNSWGVLTALSSLAGSVGVWFIISPGVRQSQIEEIVIEENESVQQCWQWHLSYG